jgi:hypothetical protein
LPQSKTRYEVGADHLPELAIPTGLMKLGRKGHATLGRTHLGRTDDPVAVIKQREPHFEQRRNPMVVVDVEAISQNTRPQVWGLGS